MSTNYCIALQPICDRNFRHIADELSYYSADKKTGVHFVDPVEATARACSTALLELGLPSLIGERTLMIKAPIHWVADKDLVEILPNKLIIELLDPESLDLGLASLLLGLKKRGLRLACPHDKFGELKNEFKELFDILTHDQFIEQNQITSSSVSSYQHLIRQLNCSEALSKARNDGYAMFQGNVFSPLKTLEAAPAKRQSNPIAELKLLQLLSDPESDLKLIEQSLIQQPYLCYVLMKQTNTADHLRSKPVSTIKQAVLSVGLTKLKSIVAAVTLSRHDPIQKLQLRTVLMRALLAEALAKKTSDVSPGTAFFCGLLSLFDRLNGTSLEHLLEEIHVSTAVSQALTQRAGPLGRLLNIIEDFEQQSVGRYHPKLVSLLNEEFVKVVALLNSIIIEPLPRT
ncbi:HDOD domain-containing protein [Idiomarina aquatica]|uniref:HDOD domain-containing protein n=1 Tax=Idiomarina aquatica TaxID=1327752 RepID=A0AA94JCS2_9GAMM|nr:HDOD domain-containing protein [Idiomarina aquatica]RUO42440.1 hypothetical protein CWE23_10100 [Idiomarina aquatica]